MNPMRDAAYGVSHQKCQRRTYFSTRKKLPEKLPENDGLFGIRRNLTDTGGTRPISPETKKAMETRAFQGFQGRGA
jgi:hypothetical protein